MKSLRYLSVVLLFFTMPAPRSAWAGDSKIVSVNNQTSYTLSEFYASASDSASWDTSNNLLAGQTISPGQSTTVTIADGSDECTYDLMAVLYGAAEHAYQYQVNTCNGDSTHWNISQ